MAFLWALVLLCQSARAAAPAPRVEIVFENGAIVSSALKAGDGPDSPLLVLRGVAVTDPLLYDYKAKGIPPKELPEKARELFNANAIRVAVHPGLLKPKTRQKGVHIDTTSLAAVWEFVDEVRAGADPLGMYVILDFHAIGHPGGILSTGPLFAASPELAGEFWSLAAERYKDSPEVVFELFNEPFGSPVMGKMTELTQVQLSAYYAELISEIVRAGSARNLIVLSGLEFSNDLSGFSKKPLEEVVLDEGTPSEKRIPLAERIAYGIHFYASRPNSGGPATGEDAVAKAMGAAIPKNLAVVVSEWGYDPEGNQKDVLENLSVLGRMTPKDFLDRLAADPAFFDQAKIPAMLERFDFQAPGRAEEFMRRMYDGSMIADIYRTLTPGGIKALSAGGLEALLRSPDKASSEDDAKLLRTLGGMPYSLELAGKPGFSEGLCRIVGNDRSCVAWVFTEWGGMVQKGRFGPGMTEQDLTDFGRFVRKLFDGARY